MGLLFLAASHNALHTILCFYPHPSSARERIVWTVDDFARSLDVDLVAIVVLGVSFIITLAPNLLLVALNRQDWFSVPMLLVGTYLVLVDVNVFLQVIGNNFFRESFSLLSI